GAGARGRGDSDRGGEPMSADGRDPADGDPHGPRVVVEDDRTGMHPDTVRRAVLDHLYYTCIKDVASATLEDTYQAIAHAVRDRLVRRWIRTQRTYYETGAKRVYYL